MTDTSMNERMAKSEGKMEGIEIFLPKLLARFEHMEESIKGDFKDLKAEFKDLEQKTDAQFKGLEQKIDTNRADRWMQTITTLGVTAAMLGVAIAVLGGFST
ncbi:hypothetical protein [Kiloniella sp.]|uniref:hypothetical protein n=1 Tax=Kiloniella sp. TaxID=1938587 RepID=UPI003B027ABD